ncbi:MAG: CoA-binding protein [Thermoproteota archaeon]
MEALIDEKIKLVLKCGTIAIVGLSRDPNKDSYKVAEYLKKNGYRIVPINPFADKILGENCFKSLLETPENVQKTIEVVDIFRPSEEVLPIVEQAIRLKQKHGNPLFIWMQLGIVNTQAAELAEKAGLTVIMNRCMMIEHKRFTRT